ncbi:valine--tRNA ligase [Chlamydia sp.]|uniref:valine--tRNA ligase n=1 Tax=Chlamydia sp. TaxID=35827 RepID=UPI0025B9F7A3|nr:valine--tRNA ligase [Chlamydia sp.]MBQ8498296.1 valine--tRNA ligase [Chlamydia sp.]
MNEDQFPKAYDPKSAEAGVYSFWEHSGMFIANADSKKPAYSIVMPPPNVTGILHMGHALVNTLQDMLVRYKRMQGFEVCWVPGTDHAGIATQTVVERHLKASLGKRRTDFSREEFLKHIWDWKEKSQNVILSQLRQLGCSCDWSRLRFTMDPEANKAVKTAFKILFDQGVIYRGYYLVNWDPILQTALADDEVEYEERDGWLYYIRYPIVGSEDFITVATTRPETLLGDTAIAVSPDDERYSHLIGSKVVVPFVNREIPIIGDFSVDPSFGTGVVKITPAHDKNDYRTGIDHDLPMINILTPTGEINENGGIFTGLSKEMARESIVTSLEALDLFVKKEAYSSRVGVSYRSGAIIEPYLSKQWFVSVNSFRESLREFVNSKDIHLFPPEFIKNYLTWVNNLKDWCISRQLWWGHRIPVWHNKYEEDRVICFDGEGIPEEVANDPESWYQDPDVLDTWFSSGLWPLTCFGWPNEESLDLKKFYPTSVLVTGHDILFFWVTRMVLMCSSMTDTKPFADVFLHGLIFGKSYKQYDEKGDWTYVSGEQKRDYDKGKPLPKNVVAKWEKLSKSKGNVIDPIEMIELYGADAVRLTLCSCANRGEQIDLDYRLFEEYKNFINKLWNGARFIFGHISELTSRDLEEGINKELLGLEDFYILDRFNELLARVDEYYTNYSFDKIASLAYDFFKNDLCSTYLEIIKPTLFSKQGSDEQRANKRKLLATLLVNILGVLHPVVPYITETLFQRLKTIFGNKKGDGLGDTVTSHAVSMLRAEACMVTGYPKSIDLAFPEEFRESFAFVEKLVYTIRNIRGEMQLDPRQALKAFIINSKKEEFPREYIPIICTLGGVETVEQLSEAPKDCVFSLGVVEGVQVGVILPAEQIVKERTRLEKEKSRLENSIESLSKLLASEDFRTRANPKLVQSKEDSLRNNQRELQSILDKLASL